MKRLPRVLLTLFLGLLLLSGPARAEVTSSVFGLPTGSPQAGWWVWLDNADGTATYKASLAQIFAVDPDLWSLSNGITGVVKGAGDGNGYAAAAYSDITALWPDCVSGYLGFDGKCTVPEGSGGVGDPAATSSITDNDYIIVQTNNGTEKAKPSTVFGSNSLLAALLGSPGFMNARITDSAAQFKSKDRSAYFFFDLSGISDTKTMTVKPISTGSYTWTPTFLGNVAFKIGTTFTDGKYCTYSETYGAECDANPPALDALLDPASALTFTLVDNNASAASYGAAGKADILKIDTRDGAEKVVASALETGPVTYPAASKPYESIFIHPTQFKTDGTNCGAVTSAAINSGPTVYYTACSDAPGTIEFQTAMPGNWDGGAVYIEPVAFSTQTTPAGTVEFDAAIQARGNDEAINNTWVTESGDILFDDAETAGTTINTRYNHYQAKNLTAMAASGAGGDMLFGKLTRDNADAVHDTSTQAVNISGIRAYYQIISNSAMPAPVGAVSCTSCTAGLIFASYFENTDNVELPATEICGCSSNATKSWTISGAEYSSDHNGDGSYSIGFDSYADSASIPLAVDADEGTIEFDIKSTTYGAWTHYLSFYADSNNYIGCYSASSSTITCVYKGGGVEKIRGRALSADSIWHTIKFAWRTTGSPKLSMSIDGGTVTTLDETLGTWAGAGALKLNYPALTNNAVYKLDNVKIYDYWNP